MADLPEWSELVARLLSEIPELSGGNLTTEQGELALNPDPFPEPLVEGTGEPPSEQFLQFEFCLTYNGKPYATQVVAAPSPQLAAITMEQFVALLNAWATASLIPPLFAAMAGRCVP